MHAEFNKIIFTGPPELNHQHRTTYSEKDLEEMVEGALKQADKNNDGFIEYTEFKSVTGPI